jgi:hypothetical protein
MARESAHMWEKYGGDHSGYCLEFVNDGLFSYAREVQYSDEPAVMDINAPNGLFFFQKTLRWKKEQEARIVMFPRGGEAFQAIFSAGEYPFVQFSPALLQCVILGRDMMLANRVAIGQWANERNPPLLVRDSEFQHVPTLV